ncbi:MAG: cob(I)yrinic acid a,c-diamide adenosyltransferase [Candidatus Paceibacterota bacterium]
MFYTRRGDSGKSGLFGTKKRISKGDQVYEALGSVDELNSFLGICRVEDSAHVSSLIEVQQCLFIIQAELAGTKKTITKKELSRLEKHIDEASSSIVSPHAFVIPGATKVSAQYDFARAVCRRAERALIQAETLCPLSSATKAYINRLSSFLYVLARKAAQESGKEDTPHY